MADSYQDRYCVYVDILGFGELIDRLSHGDTPLQKLRALLRTIHEPPGEDFLEDQKDSDFRAQSISDAVCISTTATPMGLLHLFHTVEELAIRLLGDGFFVRGAIVRGRLYHDDKMVFGEALVRSFRLEQDVVRYPRIMITTPVVNDVLAATDFETDFAGFVAESEDGPRFLNVLRGACAAAESLDDLGDDQVVFCNDIAAHIQRRLQEAYDNPSHFEKVTWFSRYWNERFEYLKGRVTLIRGVGVDHPPARWG